MDRPLGDHRYPHVHASPRDGRRPRRRGARIGLVLSLLLIPVSVSTVTHTHAAAASTVLFSDGFEGGTFAAWGGAHTGGDGSATVHSATVQTGTSAARLSATTNAGSFAYLRKALAAPQADLTASADVDVAQEGAANSNVPILQLYDPVGTVVVRLQGEGQSSGTRAGHQDAS